VGAFRIIVLLVAFASSGGVFADGRDNPSVALLIEAALDSALEGQSAALGKPASAPFSLLDAKAWFYADRGFAPAWDVKERLERLISALEGLAEDGLDPELYGLAELRSRAAEDAQGADALACTDMLATRAYLNALLHLALGRLDPAQVDPIWRSGAAPGLDSQRLRVIMLAGNMLDDPGARSSASGRISGNTGTCARPMHDWKPGSRRPTGRGFRRVRCCAQG
jgi:hypothetical protein